MSVIILAIEKGVVCHPEGRSTAEHTNGVRVDKNMPGRIIEEKRFANSKPFRPSGERKEKSNLIQRRYRFRGVTRTNSAGGWRNRIPPPANRGVIFFGGIENGE